MAESSSSNIDLRQGQISIASANTTANSTDANNADANNTILSFDLNTSTNTSAGLELVPGVIQVRKSISLAERLSTLSKAIKIIDSGDNGLITIVGVNSSNAISLEGELTSSDLLSSDKNILIQCWNFASGNYTQIAQTVVALAPDELSNVLFNNADNALTFIKRDGATYQFDLGSLRDDANGGISQVTRSRQGDSFAELKVSSTIVNTDQVA